MHRELRCGVEEIRGGWLRAESSDCDAAERWIVIVDEVERLSSNFERLTNYLYANLRLS